MPPPKQPTKTAWELAYQDHVVAKAEGRPLGPLARQAGRRPANYFALSPADAWAVDKALGILDWDGSWDT